MQGGGGPLHNSGGSSCCISAIRSRSTACEVLALRSLHSQAVRVRLQCATEELLRGRLSCSLKRERPGAQNSRGRTAQPLLCGETGPDNDARPVPLGRVGRRGAPLHGHCGSVLHAAAERALRACVHSTFNPQPSSLNLQSSNFKPQHSTFNPQPSTLNFQSSNINLQLSTLMRTNISLYKNP